MDSLIFSPEIYLCPSDAVKKRPTNRESRSLRAEPAAFFGGKGISRLDIPARPI
jgi:hypothetical protein